MYKRLCRISLQAILAIGFWGMAPVRLTATPPQDSPQFDTKLYQGLRWRSIGPFRAGRVLAVTGVRGEPDVYYSGAVGGGVWKTDDAGRTWKAIFDSQPVASIGAIAVAPSDPNIVYVGSGEADMRSSISLGNGMYKSSDAGKTWVRIGLEDSRHIGRIIVDPHDENRVFVAALGHAYGPNAERGVYRSIDGGKTWQRILFKDENTGAIDLAFEPGNTKSIYATLWQTRRPPWSVYPSSNGPGSGIYRSVDGGDHWQQVTGHGLPSESLGRVGIAFAPSNPKRIYLLIEAKDAGLYRSDDHGENWKRVSEDRRITQRSWYFGEMSVDPKDPNIVYVPNVATYKSHDGGETFEAWKGAPGGDDYHELWIDPDFPERMILSCDQGAIITRNSGQTWSSWFNQPSGQFYHVATDNQFPYWVYGAQQDSGSATTASRSKYSSLNMHDWRPIEAGDENGYIAPDPLNPSVIYGGFVTRQDLRNEEIQLMPPTLAQSGSFRRTWTLPLVFSPTDPHVLYFGSQVLFRTADGGSSWQIISPDLTREDPGVPANLDPATAADAPASKRRGVIYTIAPSYIQPAEIWAGTDDGRIHVTKDEGKTWEEVTPAELTSWSKVTHIEASHFEAGTAYAAVDRHRLEDLKPYLYRTRDFGKSWNLITQGIPEGSFLNCVRQDPVRKELLYACAETGVYVSFNEGENWQPLQLNLPTTSVRDLVIHENDLVIATFGRAFWILDDVTPLRLIDKQVATSDAWLFAPAITYRLRPGYDQSTPVPVDEPMADNPPDGAVVDYYLKEKSRSPISIEIFDGAGRLVQRFSSDDALYKTKPESVAFTMNWVHDPQPLLNEPGMHRFLWDLHYALPNSVHRSELLAAGPWVVPGDYSVKLTVNGKPLTQPLTVKPDPRSSANMEALQKQLSVASQLMEELSEVSTALRQSGELQKQIEQRKANAAGNAEVLKALNQINEKIRGATNSNGGYGYFMLFGMALPDTNHESLTQVNSALEGLYIVAQNADVAPTSDVSTAAQNWQAAAQVALTNWNNILSNDLPKINSQIQKANLSPLMVK
jgi:photosystem II stability/assembly factor-like uncharacterized protein